MAKARGRELECGVARVRVTNITIDENKTRDFYHRPTSSLVCFGGV